MDVVRTIYKELFSINFLHNSYGSSHHNSLADDISFQPDKLTSELLLNHIMDFRLLDNTLVCFMRCNLLNPPAKDPKIPFIRINGEQRIRFMIQAGSRFFNNTNIEVAGAKKTYQFSNRFNVGTNNFITWHEEGVDSVDLADNGIVKADTSCLAVIDIYTTGALNSNYELFTGVSQQLKSPVFLVRFISKN